MFKSNKNRPMALEDIINLVSPFKVCLRKMDGQRYKADIAMSVRSGLNMKCLFMKDSIGNWRLNERVADSWEENQY